MAIFNFKVISVNHRNNGSFCVSVGELRLRNKSKLRVELKKGQFFIFKFDDKDKDHAHLNWDSNDPFDDNKPSRHYLKDLPGDFNNNNGPFTLTQEGNDKLSWKVTNNEKDDGVGDEHVNVTFGEDAP